MNSAHEIEDRKTFSHAYWKAMPHFRKYGNDDVVVGDGKIIGRFYPDDIKDAFTYGHFFEDTGYLWQEKKVLDLGCGGPEVGNKLKSIYPTVDYTGLDIERDVNPDILYDAARNLPFYEGEFDTISAFGMLPYGAFMHFINGLVPGIGGNIKHVRRPLKDNGHFVAACVQCPGSEKPGWYTTIRKAFRIIEEKRYFLTYKRDDSGFAVPMEQSFVIAVQK